MQRISLSFAALLASVPLLAAELGPPLPDYPVDQVAPHTYVIHGPREIPTAANQGFMNNPAWVVTPEGVVVIDPGSSLQTGEMVLRAIRKQSDAPIIAVINTHVHGDHWLGNQPFRNLDAQLPIYAHPRMIELVEQGTGHSWRDSMLRMTEGASAGTEVVGPTIAVNDGDVLELGGWSFRIHHIGGAHTDNDIMIAAPEESLLFTGDNVSNGRVIRMDDGTFLGNVATLRKIAAELEVDHVVPGHGQSGDEGIIGVYADLLERIYNKVAELREAGLPDYEMKEQVIAALPEYQGWNDFDSGLGKLISLAYLEAESREFQ